MFLEHLEMIRGKQKASRSKFIEEFISCYTWIKFICIKAKKFGKLLITDVL